MKKAIFSIILGLFAVAAMAAAPTLPVRDANIYISVDTVMSSSTGDDTLVSATDTSIVLTKYKLDPGYDYILARDAITGTGSDSVAIKVECQWFAFDGDTIYTTTVDSMTASAGEAIDLAYGATGFGDKVTLRLFGYTGNGTQVILNRLSLWKRELRNISKRLW